MQVSIDVNFSQEYLPVDILDLLLISGWSYQYENNVNFLKSDDIDNYDWQSVDIDFFNFESFIDSHKSMGKVGIVIVCDNRVGGELLIYRDYLSFSLSINRRYLSRREIPDFNWYLERLSLFLDEIRYSSIKCEVIL